MKLSVSTFGWNNFSFADFVSVAREMRLDGIEIHDIGESRFTGVGAPFQKNEIDHTVRSLKALGLSITCLDARMNPAEADENGDKVQEIKNLIAFAEKVGAPFVRLRALSTGEGEEAENANVKALVYQVGKRFIH